VFKFIKYNNDQVKVNINTEHIYKTYIELFHKYNKSNGIEYLYRKCYDTRKRVPLGRRVYA